jgi:hypothetical protein
MSTFLNKQWRSTHVEPTSISLVLCHEYVGCPLFYRFERVNNSNCDSTERGGPLVSTIIFGASCTHEHILIPFFDPRQRDFSIDKSPMQEDWGFFCSSTSRFQLGGWSYGLHAEVWAQWPTRSIFGANSDQTFIPINRSWQHARSSSVLLENIIMNYSSIAKAVMLLKKVGFKPTNLIRSETIRLLFVHISWCFRIWIYSMLALKNPDPLSRGEKPPKLERRKKAHDYIPQES